MNDKKKDRKIFKKIEKVTPYVTAASFVIILIAGLWIMIRQILTLEMVSILNVCLIESILCLTAYCAFRGRVYYLFLPAAAGGAVLTGCTCFIGVTPIDKWYLLQTAAALAALVFGAFIWLPKRKLPSLSSVPKAAAGTAIFLTAASLSVWGVNTVAAKQAALSTEKSIWAVPSHYDLRTESQAGTVERISYQTKAYATDNRTVTKSACVYLPYGYDSKTPYNILYLMHGTGDDESY